MKVLWVLNSPMPEALSGLTGRKEVSKSTGSWVTALAEALSGRDDISLYTVSPSHLVNAPQEVKAASATHFIVPAGGSFWEEIHDSVHPDVVHIHGTEYPFFIDFIKACGSERVVVSIQGLVSEIRQFYFGGIPEDTVRRFTSFRDRIRRDSLLSQKADIELRGDREIELLKSVKHVIGRTGWDRDAVTRINPAISYHFGNEALREPFYSGEWDFKSCVPHRIFVSQAHYPLKGLHKLLEAMPTILKRFPDTSVHIAGVNPLRGNRPLDKVLRNGYGCFIAGLIKKLKLGEKVVFIGESDASTMKREMLEANIFVLPSIIENSPNALCEAQMLGVPIVAANVGGVKDLVPNKECGILYQFEDTDALAASVIDVLDNSLRFDNSEMRETALKRHNREAVIKQLIDAYVEVAS